jgi:hypothetical protein
MLTIYGGIFNTIIGAAVVIVRYNMLSMLICFASDNKIGDLFVFLVIVCLLGT